MTRRRTTFLALAVSILGMSAFARAQTSIEPHVVVPQMRVIAPPSTTPIVSLELVDADIEFNGDIATTTIRLQLANPSGSMQEAVVIMPVPSDAAIRSFRLEGLGDEGVAKLMPRDEARKIYDDIVRSMRDPGLLEFDGLGVIRSSVFPVPANGTQAAEIVYEQVLGYDMGRLDYELPRTGLLGSGGAAEWSIDLRIKNKIDAARLFSPTHELKKSDGCAQCWTVVDSAAPGPFIASLLPGETGHGLGASLIAYPDPGGDGGYFMFVAAPPKPEWGESPEREVTIVIDRSGSMRGDKLEQAREAALQIVAGLKNGERFNIIDYSDTVEAFADGPVVKSKETAVAATAYLEAITAGGGTNIHDALLEAVRAPTGDGVLPMVLFLTDGLPTIGPRSEVEIRDAVATHNTEDRRIFTFGVGYDVNAPLLSEIASSSRGASTFVRPEEDVEVKVGQVFRRLDGPVLAEPSLVFAKGDRRARRVWDTLPHALPDVFEGDRLTVFGRYRGTAPIDVTLSGTVGDKERAFELSFEVDGASMRRSYIARMWASRKIASLVTEIRRAGADGTTDAGMKELTDEIVHLSLKFGILTEYTAFLATEPEYAGRAFAPAAAADAVGERLERRAARAREGIGAVNQELNTADSFGGSASKVASNTFYDADMNEVEVTAVQQIATNSAFKRAGRWVQAELIEFENDEPDETVEFGTDRYFDLARQLAAEGRNAMLAVRGDVLLDVEGKRVLVRGPRS
jgi:Ca-activated chloride channel family protein